MLIVSDFFPSDTSRSSLLAAQSLVAERAITEDDFGELTLVGGADQAFLDERVISGIVVLEYDSLEVVERVYSVKRVSFPYIPTFLSFREGPAIVSAFRKLKKKARHPAHRRRGDKPSTRRRAGNPRRRGA